MHEVTSVSPWLCEGPALQHCGLGVTVVSLPWCGRLWEGHTLLPAVCALVTGTFWLCRPAEGDGPGPPAGLVLAGRVVRAHH